MNIKQEMSLPDRCQSNRCPDILGYIQPIRRVEFTIHKNLFCQRIRNLENQTCIILITLSHMCQNSTALLLFTCIYFICAIFFSNPYFFLVSEPFAAFPPEMTGEFLAYCHFLCQCLCFLLVAQQLASPKGLLIIIVFLVKLHTSNAQGFCTVCFQSHNKV